MGIYINEITIHRLLDKSNLKIQAQDDGKLHHFILTGPNGAGKTTLFNAIAKSIDEMFKDTHFDFADFKKNLGLSERLLAKAKQEGKIEDIEKYRKQCDNFKTRCDDLWGTVELAGLNYPEIFSMVRNHKYVIAFFGAERLSHFIQVKSPVKPDLAQKELKKSKRKSVL